MIDELKSASNTSLFPNWPDWNQRNAHAYAVDGKKETCMLTRWSAVKGDYFGVQFLGEVNDVGRVVLRGSADFENMLGKEEEDVTGESWEVWTLRHGATQWVSF